MVVSEQKKIIHFGSSPYEDYTTHKDDKRKTNYLKRHHNEDWTITGIDKAGFWSRWILWNKTTLQESIKDVEEMFGIVIKQGSSYY
jgi:hypothetical protein